MKHAKRSAAVVAVTVSVLVLGTAPVHAQSKTATKATEVGVSDKVIRIAAIDDVDNPIVPGVLQGIVDGVNGAAKMINAEGGIAGRKLQVDFIDSKLNPNEARNAFITACGQDYAMVGTGALLIGTVQDAIDCKDEAGQPTGIPDIAALATGVQEACAPIGFPINGSQIDCATVDQTPQRYQGLVGDSAYYVKKFGPLHGTFIVSNDSKPTQRASSVLGLMAQKAGVKFDSSVARSGGAQQSEYTAIAQQMKNDGSNYNLDSTAVDGVIVMRQEAQLQGLDANSKVLWACPVSCYDKKMVAAGNVMDNTYMTLSFLPFDETKSNKMLANFVKYVGKDKVSGFASWGFTSALLFKQAVEDVVKAHGVNGLTRANLLTALKGEHGFNAGGLVGTRDAGARSATPCFVIERYNAGKFTRVYPAKKGTMDCKPSNNAYVTADLLG